MNGYTHSHILALFKTLEKTQTGTKRKSVLMLLDTFLVLTEEIEQNTYFKKINSQTNNSTKGVLKGIHLCGDLQTFVSFVHKIIQITYRQNVKLHLTTCSTKSCLSHQSKKQKRLWCQIQISCHFSLIYCT